MDPTLVRLYCLVSRPYRFTPGEAATGYVLDRKRVGPRADLDYMKRRRIFPLSGQLKNTSVLLSKLLLLF
jgi:hypothetical protein